MIDPEPKSPCINLCTLDRVGICVGCFRSIEEIARWTSMSAAERWRVIEAAQGRRHAQALPRSVVND